MFALTLSYANGPLLVSFLNATPQALVYETARLGVRFGVVYIQGLLIDHGCLFFSRREATPQATLERLPQYGSFEGKGERGRI